MNTAFLTVVLVMVLLIIFVLLIVRSLTISAGIRIRADMVKLLESYDQIIEAKTKEIDDLRKQTEKLKSSLSQEPSTPVPAKADQSAGAVGAASIPTPATYRSSALGDGYGSIRQNFRFSQDEEEDLAQQVAEIVHEEKYMRGADAARLRESLSFDTVFRLIQMSPDDQLELLDTTLSDEDWVLLRDYCEERSTPFNITDFCTWLDELIKLESEVVQIRSSLESDPENDDLQSGICEGVQIVAGNKLYDYSINEREIS